MSIFKTMIELTHFRQSDSSRCGPACVRMVLDYYGIDDTENNVANACNWSYESGCDNEGMVRALGKYGVGAKLVKASIADLRYWVKHHIPVIVDFFDIGWQLSDLPNGHSAVLVDIDREKVYLCDPAVSEIRAIGVDEFARCWFDWKENVLDSPNQMTLRQIIVPYPNKFNYNG